jgi:hypothetical protein
MSMGTRAKLNGGEWDAFHRYSRRALMWGRGELKRMKRRFWRRQRASERSKLPRTLADANFKKD